MKKKFSVCIGACAIALLVGLFFKLKAPQTERLRSALPPHSCYSFVLTESDNHIPCLEAEIEGISFLAKLDLGFDGVLSLPKRVLEQLQHKDPAGRVLCASVKGNTYEIPTFTIPKLSLGNLNLVNIPVEESLLEFECDTLVGSDTYFDPEQITARIGWRAFLGTVILIDLQKSLLVCADSLATLQENNYPNESFAVTHLLSDTNMLEFEALIDSRNLKCILDTGSTLNLIHTPPATSDLGFGKIDFEHPLPHAQLSINGHSPKPCVFHPTQLPFGAEAVLGVDFLKTQIICLDLVHNRLYFSR